MSELTRQSYPDVVSVYDAPDHEQIARMILALDWYARTGPDLAERAGLEGSHQAISGLLRRLEGVGLATRDTGPGWYTTPAAQLVSAVLSELRGKSSPDPIPLDQAAIERELRRARARLDAPGAASAGARYVGQVVATGFLYLGLKLDALRKDD